MRFLRACVCVLVLMTAAVCQNEITAVDAPIQSTNTNYAYYQAVVALNSPYLTSQTPKISGGLQVTGADPHAIDQEPPSTAACALQLTAWSALDSVVSSYKKTNFIIQGQMEGNGAATAMPTCVMSQAWADASALPYTQNTFYLPGDYILENGYYWQLQAGCYTSNVLSNFCESGSSAQTFPSTSGAANITDGSVVWVQIQTGHAPPQDVVCGNGHSCGCNTTSTGQIYNINNLGTGATACTLAQIYSGQPIPELPYWHWYQQVIAALITHYNGSSLLSLLGYFRFGFPMGGEYGGVYLAVWPYRGSGASQMEAQFESWVSRVDAFVMGVTGPSGGVDHFVSAVVPLMEIYSDINCASGTGYSNNCYYADAEATLANTYGMAGFGNQDLIINDFYNLANATGASSPCAFPLSPSSCTQGDWAYNCNKYAATQKCELQLLNGSTPLDCAMGVAGLVGNVEPLPAGSLYCPAGNVGLLQSLTNACSVGYGSSNTKICVTTVEMPIIIAAGTYPTQQASDILLALSPTYNLTVGYESYYAPLQWSMENAFAGYLGIAGPPQPVPTINGNWGAMGLWSFGQPPASGTNYSSGPPPGYTAYSGSDIVQWPTVPVVSATGTPWFKNNAVVYDTSYPSGVASRITRCTDQATAPTTAVGNHSKSAGLGGSGDAVQMVNINDTMGHINDDAGGQGYLVPFNPTAMACSPAVTAANNLTNPGPATSIYNFGGGSWDWNNPLIWYAMGSGADAPPNGVAEYTFVDTTTTYNFYVTNPSLLDFSYGLPDNTTLAPAWVAGASHAYGDYVSYAFTEPDWAYSTAYALGTGTTPDPIIVPLLNNYYNCAFKLSLAGTSAALASEPVWSKSTDKACLPPSNGQITDGTAKWRNLGGPATFVYQSVGSAGTDGTTAPAFSPIFASTVTDHGQTWQNVSPLVPPTWQSFAGISRNSKRFCSAFSNNQYGDSGNYNNYNGDQGTGIFAECYDTGLNEFFLLNTLTGIQSVVSCSGGVGYACTGGAQSKLTAVGSVSEIANNCEFPIHNLKGSDTLDYDVITRQGDASGNGFVVTGCTSQNMYGWEPFLTFSPSATLQVYDGVSNHWTIRHATLVNVGDESVLGYGSGAYTSVLNSTAPTATPLTSWQVGAPYTNACDIDGVWYPLDPNPPCDFANGYDSHMGSAFNPPSAYDTAPICGSMYNYNIAPTPGDIPYYQYTQLAPYQGEELCVSTIPTWSVGGTILGWKVWRFGHSFATEGNPDFDAQFAISQMSASGKYLWVTSDWACTLGTTSGTSSPLYCGSPWITGTTYTTGQMVNPFNGASGSGTNYGVFEVTTPGVAASSAPTWFVCNSSTAGNTVTDANGVVYTCLGTGNGKGEVFIYELVP